MYIDIQKAATHGLEISIEHDKASGTERLIIQPERGVDMSQLYRDMHEALRDQLELSEGMVTGMIDDFAASVHQATIWERLRKLDDSIR